MEKQFILDEEAWKAFKEYAHSERRSENDCFWLKQSWRFVHDSEPERYPCVVVYDTYEDHRCIVNLYVEFVYLNDFEQEKI